jgi:hypothetical protein
MHATSTSLVMLRTHNQATTRLTALLHRTVAKYDSVQMDMIRTA